MSKTIEELRKELETLRAREKKRRRIKATKQEIRKLRYGRYVERAKKVGRGMGRGAEATAKGMASLGESRKRYTISMSNTDIRMFIITR